MSSGDDPPPPCLERATSEEQARLDVRIGWDVPGRPRCARWRGGARVRFRGVRWFPRRLLFALALPENLRLLPDAILQNSCGDPTCVAPAHQFVTPRIRPRFDPSRNALRFFKQ